MAIFNSDKMKALIREDAFLQFAQARMMKAPGETEANALEVLFNTYVQGDGVMEKRFENPFHPSAVLAMLIIASRPNSKRKTTKGEKRKC